MTPEEEEAAFLASGPVYSPAVLAAQSAYTEACEFEQHTRDAKNAATRRHRASVKARKAAGAKFDNALSHWAFSG